MHNLIKNVYHGQHGSPDEHAIEEYLTGVLESLKEACSSGISSDDIISQDGKQKYLCIRLACKVLILTNDLNGNLNRSSESTTNF